LQYPSDLRPRISDLSIICHIKQHCDFEKGYTSPVTQKTTMKTRMLLSKKEKKDGREALLSAGLATSKE